MKTMNSLVSLMLMSISAAAMTVLTSCSQNDLPETFNKETAMTRAGGGVGRIIDLSQLTADYTAQDGDILTGTLTGIYKISVNSDNAIVTLRDVNITNLVKDSKWAGINCENNTTLILEGNNEVRGGISYEDLALNPGIYIAPGKTLTIEGDGALTVSPQVTKSSLFSVAAGIGGGFNLDCGNIVINSGTVVARGGRNSSAIGGGGSSILSAPSCGTITINGGNITATHGEDAIFDVGPCPKGGIAADPIVKVAIKNEHGDIANVYPNVIWDCTAYKSGKTTKNNPKKLDCLSLSPNSEGNIEWDDCGATFNTNQPGGFTFKCDVDYSKISQIELLVRSPYGTTCPAWQNASNEKWLGDRWIFQGNRYQQNWNAIWFGTTAKEVTILKDATDFHGDKVTAIKFTLQ